MFVIICSFDNYQSYENIDIWLTHIEKTSKNLSKNLVHFLPIVLLINKNDLKNSEKKFKFSEVNQKIKNLNLSITAYTFSSKDNCKDVFEKIEYLLNENLERTNNSNRDTLSNTPNGMSTIQEKSFGREKSNTFKITRNSFINNKENNASSCCN